MPSDTFFTLQKSSLLKKRVLTHYTYMDDPSSFTDPSNFTFTDPSNFTVNRF